MRRESGFHARGILLRWHRKRPSHGGMNARRVRAEPDPVESLPAEHAWNSNMVSVPCRRISDHDLYDRGLGRVVPDDRALRALGKKVAGKSERIVGRLGLPVGVDLRPHFNETYVARLARRCKLVQSPLQSSPLGIPLIVLGWAKSPERPQGTGRRQGCNPRRINGRPADGPVKNQPVLPVVDLPPLAHDANVLPPEGVGLPGVANDARAVATLGAR
jgi:hypothetical protein